MGTLRNEKSSFDSIAHGGGSSMDSHVANGSAHAAAGSAGATDAAVAFEETPSFRTKPWVRALSVVMSFLLAFTMFDATGLTPLLDTAQAAPQDQAQPAGNDDASGDTADDAGALPDPDSPGADDEPSSADEPDSQGDAEDQAQPAGNDDASGDTADDAGALPDPDSPGADDEPSSADEPDSQGDADADEPDSQGDAADHDSQGDADAEDEPAAPSEEQIAAAAEALLPEEGLVADEPDSQGDAADHDSQGDADAEDEPAAPSEEQIAAAAEALLPEEGLVDAADVLPSANGGSGDVSSMVNPSLALFNAPLASSGAFYVLSSRLRAEVSLGNLGESLAGGYLAGASKDDRLVLSFGVPYLYENADGGLSSTLSEERWRVLRGTVESPADANGPRAVMYASLPEGWSAWQEHGSGYVALTDDDLSAGVSGRVLLRYDGNDGKLDAETELPTVEFGFRGTSDAGAAASVSFGYEVHSYTPRVTEDAPDPRPVLADVSLATIGTVSLVNDEADLGISIDVESDDAPVAADGAGYLSSIVSVKASKAATFVRAITLGAAFPADWEGRAGVPLSVLMANVVDDEGSAQPNDGDEGSPDLSDDFRRSNSFIGVPGAGGVLVADVTNLTEAQRRRLNPADPASFQQAGVELLPYTVDDQGRIQVAATGIKGRVLANEERLFYVAAPYAQDALDLEEATTQNPQPDTYKPVTAAFDVQTTCVYKGSTVAYPQRFVQRIAFKKGADSPIPPLRLKLLLPMTRAWKATKPTPTPTANPTPTHPASSPPPIARPPRKSPPPSPPKRACTSWPSRSPRCSAATASRFTLRWRSCPTPTWTPTCTSPTVLAWKVPPTRS